MWLLDLLSTFWETVFWIRCINIHVNCGIWKWLQDVMLLWVCHSCFQNAAQIRPHHWWDKLKLQIGFVVVSQSWTVQFRFFLKGALLILQSVYRYLAVVLDMRISCLKPFVAPKGAVWSLHEFPLKVSLELEELKDSKWEKNKTSEL